MVPIKNIVKFVSGTPQFRIVEDAGGGAPAYFFYTQADLESDIVGLVAERPKDAENASRKQISTFDAVNTLSAGDMVFSLLSGKAAIVRDKHSGYLFTQNYVVLKPSEEIDVRYLAYLINENREVARQFRRSQQGSKVIKYTLAQLSSLLLPALPSRERQKLIGELYFNQMRLNALHKRASELETALVLERIRKVGRA